MTQTKPHGASTAVACGLHLTGCWPAEEVLERSESDPYKCREASYTCSTHLVVSQSVITDSTSVARKLCPCTRPRQKHAVGSVGALPKCCPTLPNEGNERPTTPKNGQIKAFPLGPNL